MQLFVLTSHCKSKVHCQTCRNKEGGRSWRANLTNYYIIPDAPANTDKIDFECPYGIPWLNTNIESQIMNQNNVPQPQKPVVQKVATVNSNRNSDSRNTKSGGCNCGRKK